MPSDDASRPPRVLRSTHTQVVGILLIPDFALMSYASLIEPFRAANRMSGRNLYQWRHISSDGASVSASNGVSITPDYGLRDPFVPDILFVCAGGNPALFDHQPTYAYLRRIAHRRIPVGGVSGGPYVLARAQLLDGYRCTIHWEHIPAFLEEFPRLQVARSLYVIDRDRLTCAGGIAALDMTHELIVRDHGPWLAGEVSDQFLHGRVRLGSGPQRMTLRERYGVSHPKLLKVLEYMEGRIEEPAGRGELAGVANLSMRQLERLFQSHLGSTVGGHYIGVRLDRAQMLLRQTTMPVLEVGIACGFVSASHFSRSYRQRFGHSPKVERAAPNASDSPGRGTASDAARREPLEGKEMSVRSNSATRSGAKLQARPNGKLS